MSLKDKTIKGVFWTVSQEASVQLINFLVQILLARLLTPEDFGLIAMLNIFVSVGNMLIDGGLTSSLIRTNNADNEDYSTVFFINFIGSAIIYFVLFFSAPAIASFYDQETLINIIRVYTISLIIRAFMAVQVTKLTKEMNFKKQMGIQVPSVIGGGILGISLAYLGYGVWSLVYMTLFQTVMLTMIYWIKSDWYPSFILNKKKMKYHFNFGYKLTLVGLINVIYQNIYSVLIGKYFTTSQLGFYNQANSLRMFPVKQINKALGKVTYPMFSSVKQDDFMLKNLYRKVMQQIIFWVTPLMLFLVIVAEPLFKIVLTEKWLPAVLFFQILCFSAIIYPLTTYNINILKVKGRSDIIFKISVIKFIFLFACVFFIIRFGLLALVYFHAFSTLISYFMNAAYSGKMINYSVKQQLKDIYLILILGFVTGGICWALFKFLIFDFTDWLKISIIGACFIIIYFGLSYLFKISALKEFKIIIQNFTLKKL